MQKSLAVLTLAALAACAHAEPPQPLPERDWGRGLDDQAAASPSIAPLGPIDSDQNAYDFIRRREREHSLASKATGRELDEIVGNSSQVLASALAMPLFRAGVFYGQPSLIDKGCTAAGRVNASVLRSTGNVDAVLQACAALTVARTNNDGCGEGQQKLREAYALLAADKGSEAGRVAAEAVRGLRDRCPKIGAPLRTPVDPTSRGFLIVWTLHANDAAPATFLAGESAPTIAESINETFLRGVQAVRTVAHN